MDDHTAVPGAENPPFLIDARGLNCPLPVLKLRKALKGRPVGFAAVLLATDAAALNDVPAYCRAAGLEVRAGERTADGLRFHIVVGG